jgi:hypothetical protein
MVASFSLSSFSLVSHPVGPEAILSSAARFRPVVVLWLGWGLISWLPAAFSWAGALGDFENTVFRHEIINRLHLQLIN